MMNPIEISLCYFDNGEINSKKICTIKWDSKDTPLVIAKELNGQHYHHYLKEGKLVAHVKEERTGQRNPTKPGISNSVTEILARFHNIPKQNEN